MKTFKALLLTAITILSITAVAGSEHDHGAPSFQPPKGGILKSTHSMHLELVKGAKGIIIYAYNMEGKALGTKNLQLDATLELPRKKPVALKLENKETHWEAAVDSQGTHRYTVKVNIDDGKEKDYVKFTIENK